MELQNFARNPNSLLTLVYDHNRPRNVDGIQRARGGGGAATCLLSAGGGGTAAGKQPVSLLLG